MRLPRWMVASALIVAASLGSAPALADDEGGTATLTGSVSLREPGDIPAGSVLTVTVEDTSRADAPAVPLAQAQIDLTDQRAPIPFELPYPTAALDQRAVYTARARVTMGDRLLFTTTDSNRVDVFNPAPADLVMSAVAPPAPTSAPAPDAALADTYWKLVDVDGAPVVVAEQLREPHLVLNSADSRFAGSGGVNRLMGGYASDGIGLTFGQTATTMMAGPPEAMAQEQLIVAALQRVRGFRIAGDILTLLDGAGTPVLRAVAVALN